MTSAREVRKLVLSEAGGPHCLDLDACILDVPLRQTCTHSSRGGERTEMWLVLQDGVGYSFVFDDDAGVFGHAVGKRGDLVVIGYYGSFLDSMAGM